MMNTRPMWSSFSRIIKHSLYRSITRTITTASQSGGKFNTDISAYSSISHAVTPLNSYGLLKVTGKDSSTFLQGLITNDIINTSNATTYNTILTPNGRYLYDCFISQCNNNSYLIETDINAIPNLIKYFKKYKLRSKVKFENLSNDYRIWSVLTTPKTLDYTYNQLINNYKHKINESNEQNICYIDPRYNGLGIRMILNINEIPYHLPDNFAPIGEDFYYTLKCIYGIPTHGIDLITDKTIILESNLNYLNGVSFTKGCYVGQELIARTHFRGQIRKRLFGASIVTKYDIYDINMVKRIVNEDSDRDTILPNDVVNIENCEYDYRNRNIIDINSNKIVGKVTSDENIINCCMVQLRNNAFMEDINSDEPKSVGLQIENTDYVVVPHYNDYLGSFSELFASKEVK
eukprot:453194_1